jgi:DNA primase
LRESSQVGVENVSFRDRLDVEKLLDALGVEFSRKGRRLVALCPNPEHRDSEPSWSIVDDPGTSAHSAHHCFSCKFGGGPWELVIAVRGVDEQEAFRFIGEIVRGVPRVPPGVPRLVMKQPLQQAEYSLPSGVQIPSIDGSTWPAAFEQYLESRGTTPEQIERWMIGFATRGELAWRVVIPVHTRGRLVAHVGRAIFKDGRARYDMPRSSKRGAVPQMALFGEPLLDPALGVLTIAEGSFSMLALERAGAPNPVALLGSDWSPAKAAILSATPWAHVVIATDPDMAGDRVARAISVSFRRSKISRLRLDQSPDDCEQEKLSELIGEVVGGK